MIDVPGATPEEIAAITAVLASRTQEEPAGECKRERMSPWKRANREPDIDLMLLRHAGDRFVL